MKLSDFDFELPSDLIAQNPVYPRDTSKMLVIDQNKFDDRQFFDLPNYITKNDLVICNNTKVLASRLEGKRHNTSIQITLHKMNNNQSWHAFAKPAKKLYPGNKIYFAKKFSAEIIEKSPEGVVLIKFCVNAKRLPVLLSRYGKMPIPPYIQKFRKPDLRDNTDYQTTYANNFGAVAAPTAGLHFTKRLIRKLREKKINFAEITLHVGAGTFLPIRCKDINQHLMQPETGYISKDVAKKINHTKKRGGRIIAVGTTSLRLLETATDSSGTVQPFSGETNIFIKPPYRFKCVDLLLTNFHLPKSTLFILVCAFAGIKKMKRAYEYAKIKNYRFFSYGDGTLIYRKK